MGFSNWISEETKKSISEKQNSQLWKLIEFKNLRSTRIILGDSRANIIKDFHLREITGSDYYNFAYPGGTLIDMIETFWYANDLTRLEEVYMGINFNLYNNYETNNNVKQAESIMKDFFSYSFSKITFITSLNAIKKQFFVKDLQIGNPDMDRSGFWNYVLDVTGRRFYQKYKHPDKYRDDLIRISEYCKANKIKLIFFIPPNHVEWQKRVTDFELEEEYKTFLKDILSLGTVYNLDVANDFTGNKDNFYDPMHILNDSILIQTIWAKQTNNQ
jgi:hypothetical protein